MRMFLTTLIVGFLLACASGKDNTYARPPAVPDSKTAFRCSNRTSGIVVPAVQSCDDSAVWDYTLDDLRKVDRDKFEKTVRDNVTNHTNLGAAIFDFGAGGRKTVYRSSFLSSSPACLKNLVTNRGVETIVNLYAGDIRSHAELANIENTIFRTAGGRQYTQVLGYDYRIKKSSKEKIFTRIREIISTIKSSPGNVLIHCYGGMHRSGIVFGVLQKCVNHVSLDDVIAEYRCHTVYESEKRPGGSDKENEELIRDFPCSSI